MPTHTFTPGDIRALKRAKQYVSFPIGKTGRYEVLSASLVNGRWRA